MKAGVLAQVVPIHDVVFMKFTFLLTECSVITLIKRIRCRTDLSIESITLEMCGTIKIIHAKTLDCCVRTC